ncbi:unnamed protein product, partial [Iphiclides podalirius]
MVLEDVLKGRVFQRVALVACLLIGTLTPEPLEPCTRSPLCSCRASHMSCIAVPLHRFPEWPHIELQHLDISMSNLEIISESALDGLHLQTLVLVANRLHHIENNAFSSMANSLASLDLGYNEFTEIPHQGLKDLKVLNWLNLQNNNIACIKSDIRWYHLEETLTTIFYPNFTSWSHVATKLLSGGLILTGNPLVCECELNWLGAWLRRWFQENEAGTELRRAVRDAYCVDKYGRHVPLLQLRADEAECHASALSSDAQTHYSNTLYIVVVSLWILLLR